MRATSPLAVIGLTAFLVFGTVATPAHAAEVTTTSGGVTYTADTTNVPAGATATDYASASGSAVMIPPTVEIGGTEYTVTTIGDDAFYSNALTSVTLPNSLTTIGEWAFAANALTSVSLPETLTTIGDYAFAGNDLTSVSLPDTLTTIGEWAFYSNLLTSVSLPDTLTTLGDSAFRDNDLTSVTLPDTLTAIGDWAFLDNSLTSVSLPDTLTTLGDSAFAYNALTSVSLPDTLTTLGEAAFAANALTSVSLPDTLTTIGQYTFYNNAITSVSLPDTLTTIGNNAFYNNALDSVTLPDTLTTIGSSAFADNSDLASVRFLGAAPATFGLDVFTSDPMVSYYWKYGDSQASGGFTTPTWKGYATQAIAILDYDTDGGTIIAPVETVVGSIATAPTAPTKTDHTFDDWYTAATGGTAWTFTTDTVTGDMTLFARYAAEVSTTSGGITYTADTTNVPAGATATDYDSASGSVVTIPATVTIGGTDYTVTTIGDAAFTINSLTSVTLPDTLTTIGNYAFAINSLTSVTLPDTLTTIGGYAFEGNDLTEVSLPDTLTTLGDGAFYNNALTSVTLPDTLTTLGNNTFYNNALTSVTLPDTLTTIGEGAFYNNALTSVTLPDTLTTIGEGAFEANSLTSVTLPDTLTTLGDYAFANNSDLASVRFLGAAPATFGSNVFTSDPLVSYYWSYGNPQTSGGFTPSSWNGYTTQAIAILTYDTNDGTTIDPVETVVGTTATAQAAATKTDHTFDGWYTAATGGTTWNFTTDTVTGDMTLFARYTAVPATPTGTTETALAATGVGIPAIPAGIGAALLLAGIALLTRRRQPA